MLTNDSLAMNTATNVDGTRAVVLKVDGNALLVDAATARAMAAALVELADEIDPEGKQP